MLYTVLTISIHLLDLLFGLPFTHIYICILFEYIHISYIYIHVYIYIDISHVLDRRRAIDQLGASWSNSTVVDVGAGTGVLSVMCGKRAKKVMGTMGSGGETGEIEDFQQILSIVDRDVIARKKLRLI